MLAHCCFSQWCVSAARQPVPRRGQYTLSTPWNQVSGDPTSWTAWAVRGPSSPGYELHRKQRVWLMYMSLCGLWSQPHPTFKPASCKSNRKWPRVYIYSHIVFIQRCCFAQIIMNFFTRRGHGMCRFRRASWRACKINHPTWEGRGILHLFGFFIFKVTRPGHFLFQRISGSIQPRLRKDGKQQWKNAGFPWASKYNASGKIIHSIDWVSPETH